MPLNKTKRKRSHLCHFHKENEQRMSWMNPQINLSFDITRCLVPVGFKGIPVPTLPNLDVDHVTLLITAYKHVYGAALETGSQYFWFSKTAVLSAFFSCGLVLFCKLVHFVLAVLAAQWTEWHTCAMEVSLAPCHRKSVIYEACSQKHLVQPQALRRLEAPGKQRNSTKPFFINLLQICLCWFLQMSVSEQKEPKTSVIDGLDSNVLISTIWPHIKSSQLCSRKAV